MQFLARKKPRPTIDLSPLVDVVFLLIIFFTVSTTFREGTGLPISLPSAGTAVSEPRGPVEVAIAAEGRVELDGRVYESVEELREPLAAALESAAPRRVVIRGDRQVAYETVVAVLDLSRALEAEGVTLQARRDGAGSHGDGAAD
jgi:biopolymer transport protein ExbD